MSFNTRRVRRTRSQSLLVAVVSLVALTAFGLVVVAATAYAAVQGLTKDLPDLDGPLPQVEQTTKVLAHDGTLLTRLFYDEDRVAVRITGVPRHLRQAVVAAEDQRFFRHRGVDLESIGRAVVADVRSGKVVEGGSTITQQYIKNLYGEHDKTLKRKVREALLAYRLEQRYPKDRILERYLNTIYLGHSAYGVEAAARMYFGKPASRVSIAEAALLAGLIRSPNTNSPHVSAPRARARRNRVLDQMRELAFITTAQAAAAKKTPLGVVPQRAPRGRAPYFVEYVKQELIKRYGADTVFKGGLTVRTTLDLRMQGIAERAAWDILDRPDDPAVALVAIQPTSGAIRAMVGGRHFERLRYNLATQGRRQPGSAFKPFVLATALAQGYPLEQRIDGSPGTLTLPDGGLWRVSNATEGGGGGPISLREATVRSVNAAFARLILDLGADEVADTAERMGISTTLNRDPAIALGGLKHGVTPLEMASAYGTLATRGLRLAPTPIEEVRSPTGRLIARLVPTGEPVLDEAICAMETQVLEEVIAGGTGRRAAIGRPAAGKTGTTQNYHDAWFVGYTPDLVTAVWVGYPTHQRPMRSVHGRRVWGGTFPAEIWAAFMGPALAGKPETAFGGVPRSRLVKVRICSDTNLVATQYCPRPVAAEFLRGEEPKEGCNLHLTPANLAVPRVVGGTAGQATASLAELGFVPVSTYVRSDKPAGTVLWQSPYPGNVVSYGSMVALRISAGPAGDQTDQPPRAAMSVSTHSTRIGQSVRFDASGSTDPEGPITRWTWTFGDGSGASGERVSHTYRTAGRFSVTLTVYDQGGHAASLHTQVAVQP